MKKRLCYILLLITAIGFAQNPMVKAEIDTTDIRIGEQFGLKIAVNETQNVIFPKLELKGLEIVDSTQTDTLKKALVRKYILTGFDSGAFYIPQQQIFVKNQAFLTDSLLVNVATIAVDTSKVKKFPIKAIKSEPYVFDDFKIYLYLLLAALAIIGFWIYWFVIRKRKEEEEVVTYKTLPPYDEAILRLNELDEKLLWQNNKIKQYYSELTEIVRGYIERELKVPALEKTTDEVLDLLKGFKEAATIEISEETINKLKALLQEADLVKFAKSKPLALEIEEDRKDAEEIVNSLKPKFINKTLSSKCLITGKEETEKIKLYKWGYIIIAFTLEQKEVKISLLGKKIHLLNQSIFWMIFNSFGSFFLKIPILGGTLMVFWGAIVVPFLIIISIIEFILTGTFLSRGNIYLKKRNKLNTKQINLTQINRDHIEYKLRKKMRMVKFTQYLSIFLPLAYVFYIIYLILYVDK